MQHFQSFADYYAYLTQKPVEPEKYVEAEIKVEEPTEKPKKKRTKKENG